MYYCEECGATFEEYETGYELHSEVDTRRYETIHACPNCHSDEIVPMRRCPVCNNDYVGDDDICDECKEVALDMWRAFKADLQDTLGCDFKTCEDVITVLVEEDNNDTE